MLLAGRPACVNASVMPSALCARRLAPARRALYSRSPGTCGGVCWRSTSSSPTVRRSTLSSPTSSEPIDARRMASRPMAIAPTATAPPASAPTASAPNDAAPRAPGARIPRRRRSARAMRLRAADNAPGEREHARQVGFDRCQVVFAGIDRALGRGAGAAQCGGERQVLVRIGDVVLFGAVHERVHAQPRKDRLVAAQIATESVEEADPALDHAEAVGV